MADDLDMDSGAWAGYGRGVTYTPSSLQQLDLKESSGPIQEGKKAKDLSEFNNNLTRGSKELGFAENQESSEVKDFGVPVEEKCKEKKDSMKRNVGLSGIVESIVEVDIKEGMATKVLNYGDIIDGIKLVDGDVGKIQLIDDTALIESVQVLRIGNGCLKGMGKAGTAKMMDRNQKKQMGGKMARRSKNKAKNTKIVSGMSMRVVQDKVSGLNNGDRVKIMYSREEMKALRFVNIVQQRKLWRDINTGLGPSVLNEYDNLAGSKHQKQIPKSFDSQMCFSNKFEAPGILGIVGARARRNHFKIFVH